MDLTVFALFLFNALRVLIFSIELRQGKWRLPAGPAETVQFLIERTPLLPAFPRKLRECYDRAMLGDGCFDERLMPKSRTLLAEMLEISQQGRSWESLRNLNGMADEHRLNISAAIITANRPLQLKRHSRRWLAWRRDSGCRCCCRCLQPLQSWGISSSGAPSGDFPGKNCPSTPRFRMSSTGPACRACLRAGLRKRRLFFYPGI